jgi:hypothetical protein
VIVDSSISIFPESRSSRDNAELLVVDDYPDVNCVFAAAAEVEGMPTRPFSATPNTLCGWPFGSTAAQATSIVFAIRPDQADRQMDFRHRLASSAWHSRNDDALAQLGLPGSVLRNTHAGNAAKVFARLDI